MTNEDILRRKAENAILRETLALSKKEIEWWRNEHPCCKLHGSAFLALVDEVLAKTSEEENANI